MPQIFQVGDFNLGTQSFHIPDYQIISINLSHVKRLIAIGFLCMFLLSTTEAHQLLKIPYIFQHFSTHQKENSSITFLQFLDMHYMHGSPRDKDYQDDMKLPFKTADKCVVVLSPAFVPIVQTVSKIKPVELPKFEMGVYQDNFIPSTYLSSIWQPPKAS